MARADWLGPHLYLQRPTTAANPRNHKAIHTGLDSAARPHCSTSQQRSPHHFHPSVTHQDRINEPHVGHPTHLKIESSNSHIALAIDSHCTEVRIQRAAHQSQESLTPTHKSTLCHPYHREASHPHNVLCGLHHSLHNPFLASIRKRFEARSAPRSLPRARPLSAPKSRPGHSHERDPDLRERTLTHALLVTILRDVEPSENSLAPHLPRARARRTSGRPENIRTANWIGSNDLDRLERSG